MSPGNSRYLQYQAELATSQPGSTPELADLVVSCDGESDVTPPVISNVAAAPGAGGTTAEITWDTDEPANSLVSYGTSPALGASESARRSSSPMRSISRASCRTRSTTIG